MQQETVFRRKKTRDTQAITLQYRIWSLYLKLRAGKLRWLNSMLSSKPSGLISPFYLVHLIYADCELFFMSFKIMASKQDVSSCELTEGVIKKMDFNLHLHDHKNFSTIVGTYIANRNLPAASLQEQQK